MMRCRQRDLAPMRGTIRSEASLAKPREKGVLLIAGGGGTGPAVIMLLDLIVFG